MAQYTYRKKSISSFLQQLYSSGLKRSKYLDDTQVQTLIERIGIFKFKGYLYAFRPHINRYSIDDVFHIYYFDKFLTRYVMEITSSLETVLKTRLVEVCYQRTNNPFFYLIENNHKFRNFKINDASLSNWKSQTSNKQNEPENYLHYCLYYKAKYQFQSNKEAFLDGEMLIEVCDDVNYPPFHYFVENATLGVVVYLIKSLKIGNFDILRSIGRIFGIKNPKTFKPYLERLIEIRNRAAHRERLFNRSFRSVKGVDRFEAFRQNIPEHRFVDVYLYLYFLLGRLSNYTDYSDFRIKEIEILFDEFKGDRMITEECYGLNSMISKEIEGFLLHNIGA